VWLKARGFSLVKVSRK